MTIDQSLKEIRRIEQRETAQEKRKASLIAKVQRLCRHPVSMLIEAPYSSSEFSSERPFRVCRRCGYAEEGWGAGYWRLGRGVYSGVPELSRNEAQRLVRTFVSQDDMELYGRYGRARANQARKDRG